MKREVYNVTDLYTDRMDRTKIKDVLNYAYFREFLRTGDNYIHSLTKVYVY